MKNLVKKAKKGDQEAFTALTRAISPKLLKIAQNKLNNTADIDDAIQETMLDAFSKLYQLKNPKNFEKWISKILKNNCLKILKNKNNMLLPLDESIINNCSTENLEQEKIEDDIIFQSITKNLTKDEKTIFNLKVKHNYKYKEIGKELNMSVSQIKSNFNRSKKKINTKGLGGTKNG